MKKLLILILLFPSIIYAQTYGGEIRAKDNSDVIGNIKRINDQLKAVDSLGNIRLTTIAGAVAGTEMQVDVLTMPSITSTNLDIRDLVFATDKVDVTGSVLGAGDNNIGNIDVLTVPADPFGVNADAASATGSISAKLRFIAATGIPVTSLPSVTIGTFPDNEPFNVAQINGVTPLMGNGATGTGSLRVTIANDNSALVVTQSGTWNINNISGTISLPTGAATSANQSTEITALQLIDNLPNTLGSTTSGQSGVLTLGAVTTSAPTYTTAQSNALSLQTDGSLRVANTASLVAGNNNIGDVDVATFPDNEPFNVAQINGVTPLMGQGATGTGSLRVTIANDNSPLDVVLVPDIAGGASTFHLVSAASTNATNIKASAGQLYGYYIFNANAAARKVAFHNTSGTPTAGSSVFFSLVIPAGSGANVDFSGGIAFSSGIAITTVTGTADSDATGVASGDLIINIFYK